MLYQVINQKYNHNLESSNKSKFQKNYLSRDSPGGKSTPLITNMIAKPSIYEVLGTPGDTPQAIPHGRGFGGG